MLAAAQKIRESAMHEKNSSDLESSSLFIHQEKDSGMILFSQNIRRRNR
ncbi:hypothetical protein CHCC20327_3598 [Bacillus licheniformis]|nr:hypothetical protein CHCC20327_3598 [Bacillus licheniformis]